MGLFSFLHNSKITHDSNKEMDNVIDSMFNSKPLYDELKVKCHPDKYLDQEEREQAEHLFQELQKSKHDIVAMKNLKPKIEALYQDR